MKKTYVAVYYLLNGNASKVSVFFLMNKYEYKSLTFRINFDHWQSVNHPLVYFACAGIREYPGNFQNETVISNFFFKRSAQVKSH